MFEDSDQHKGAYGNPNLSFDSVGAFSPKFFDAEVLLDPFEEDFYFPSIDVQDGNL